MIGTVIVIFWVLCAIIGYRVVPHAPTYQNLLILNPRPSGSHWFGTDQLGRDVFSRVITGVRSVLIVSVLATVMGTVLGTILGLFTGYVRGWLDESISRFVDAILALPTIMIARAGGGCGGPLDVLGDHLHRVHLHAADRPHGAHRGDPGARARLRDRRAAAKRKRPLHHVRRAPAQRDARRSSSSSRCAWAMRSSPPRAVVPGIRHPAAHARLGC